MLYACYRLLLHSCTANKAGGKVVRCAVTQADLDLGNYERFLDITLAKDNNITTGKIYQASTQRIDQAAGMNVVVHRTALTSCNAVSAVCD